MRFSWKQVIECGCCGCWHPRSFWGDCRDDRYRLVPADDGTEDFVPEVDDAKGKSA